MVKPWSDQMIIANRKTVSPADFVSAQSPQLSLKILKKFKALLTEGQIRPGDKLLPQRELSAQLQVSRPMLRETLRSLEIFGLLNTIPKHGTYVQNPNLSFLKDYFSLILTLKPSLSQDILSLRIILECGAARLAATRATSEELTNMRNILDHLAETSSGSDMGIQADFDFHVSLMKATHSDILLIVYEAIEDLLQQSHRERRHALYKIPGMFNILLKLHQEILDALISGDEQAAEDNMRKHFISIQEYDKQLISFSKTSNSYNAALTKRKSGQRKLKRRI